MNVAEDNVTPFRSRVPASAPAPQGGNGGGGNFGERLAALEGQVRHLATSAEVEKVRTEVAKVGTSVEYLKWILGIIVGGVLLILGRLFFVQ